jgi:hypothetical protein
MGTKWTFSQGVGSPRSFMHSARVVEGHIGSKAPVVEACCGGES